MEFAEQVKTLRKGKQVKLIHNGDAVDGSHHNNVDVCTHDLKEQCDIHVELMNEFQKRIKWQSGDELYYTEGTQVHTQDCESDIAKELNAVPDGDNYAWDILKLHSNGVLSMFVHHGPTRGKGAMEGSPMRSWLKQFYEDALKDGTPIPDIIYTGHVHDPTWSNYIYRNRMEFKVIHGIILPSWQSKTRYARMQAPVSVNKIGGVIQEIKADGLICIPRFSVMGSM